jgi:phosphatidylglycerol:prolipoprotein diacylglycerol transferase
MHQLIPQQGGAYAVLMAAAIVVSAIYWFAKSKHDPSLLVVYIGGLGGAFIGAKLAYIFAEVWFDWGAPDFWLRLATGKSILGGLLGGYAGVEMMKRLVGHDQSTGDAFAVILPIGLLLGRIGCWLHGCCLGRPVADSFMLTLQDRAGVTRWPAVPVEMAFLLVMLALILFWKWLGKYSDRLFFIFLAAYGLFRFAHEWMRDTPKWFGFFSGYQVIALAMVVLGAVMFVRRSRSGRHQ